MLASFSAFQFSWICFEYTSVTVDRAGQGYTWLYFRTGKRWRCVYFHDHYPLSAPNLLFSVRFCTVSFWNWTINVISGSQRFCFRFFFSCILRVAWSSVFGASVYAQCRSHCLRLVIKMLVRRWRIRLQASLSGEKYILVAMIRMFSVDTNSCCHFLVKSDKSL